ncbi:MAG: hypothetical protein LBU40_04135 [Methanobrevibacter sp.]|jgi:hypothetical protein|nr:hypothetical protein [Methanobrevibacter sp.]
MGIVEIIKRNIHVKNSEDEIKTPPVIYNPYFTEKYTGEDGKDIIDTNGRFLINRTRKNLEYISHEELNDSLLTNLKDTILSGVYLNSDPENEEALNYLKEKISYDYLEVMKEIIGQSAVYGECFIRPLIRNDSVKPIFLKVDDEKYFMNILFDEFDDVSMFIHTFPVFKNNIDESGGKITINVEELDAKSTKYEPDELIRCVWDVFEGRPRGCTEKSLDQSYRKLELDQQGVLIVYKNSNAIVVSPATDNNGYPIFGNQEIPEEYDEEMANIFNNTQKTGAIVLPSLLNANMLGNGNLPSSFDKYYNIYKSSIYRAYNVPKILFETDGGTYNLGTAVLSERDKNINSRREWLNNIMVKLFDKELEGTNYPEGAVYLSWIVEVDEENSSKVVNEPISKEAEGAPKNNEEKKIEQPNNNEKIIENEQKIQDEGATA